MPSTDKKRRAINIPENSVGMQRYNFYKQAHGWISFAMKQGFYLEAITLIESMITDRLESYLTRVFDENISFQTLGPLINRCRNEKVDEELRILVTNDLDKWREKRNQSLHAMVKVEEGDTSSWKDRKMKLPSIAEDGKEILYKISKRIDHLQKDKKPRIVRKRKKTITADERYKIFRERMDSLYRHGIKRDHANSLDMTPPQKPNELGDE